MLQLKNIHLEINGKVLLMNEEMRLFRGVVYGITGKSGSGKTTLLYELSLLSNESNCEYNWNGLLIDKLTNNDKAELRRNNISYVLQGLEVISENLTVRENFECMFALVGLEYDEKKINEILKVLNLRISMTQRLEELSGGERQRFAIALALIKDSELIVLDEPTSALDVDNANELVDYLKYIAKKYNKIIVVASHDHLVIDNVDCVFTIEDKHLKCESLFEGNSYEKGFNKKKCKRKFYQLYKRNRTMGSHILNLLQIFVVVLLCLGPYLLNDILEKQKELLSIIDSDEIVIVNSDKVLPYGTYLENSTVFTQNDLNLLLNIKDIKDVKYYWELDGNIEINDKNINVKVIPLNGTENVIIPTRLQNTVRGSISFSGQVVVEGKSNNLHFDISLYEFKDLPNQLYSNINIIYVPSEMIESILLSNNVLYSASLSITCEDSDNVDNIMKELHNWFPNSTITSLAMDKLYDIKLLENIVKYINIIKISLFTLITFVSCVMQFIQGKNRYKELTILRINGLTRKMGVILYMYENYNIFLLSIFSCMFAYVCLVFSTDIVFMLPVLGTVFVHSVIFSGLINIIPFVLNFVNIFNRDIITAIRNFS